MKIITILVVLNMFVVGAHFWIQKQENFVRFLDATIRNDFQYVEKKIMEGFDVNQQTDFGSTPLMLAAALGRKPLVELFLSHGALADSQNKNQETSILMMAATIADKKIWNKVSSHQINFQDRNGYTALFGASIIGMCSSLVELLAMGADPLLKSKINIDSFEANLIYAEANCLPSLIRTKGLPPYWDIFNITLRGLLTRDEILQALLEKNISLNQKNLVYGETLLMKAVYQGNEVLVQKLLAYGVDTNIKDNDGMLASQIARKKGFYKLAKLIEAKN
jgi:ankyrin repeat protein